MPIQQTWDDPAVKQGLEKPFPGKDVSWVIVATKDKNKPGHMDLYAPYLDADAIRDRLEEVVDAGGWSMDLEAIGDKAVICRLTIIGVMRAGLGEVGGRKDVDQPMKAAATDALKRAAVEFGIGRYLHRVNKEWRAPKAGPPKGQAAGQSAEEGASPAATTPAGQNERPMTKEQRQFEDTMKSHSLTFIQALDMLKIQDGDSPGEAMKAYLKRLETKHKCDRAGAWRHATDALLAAMKAHDGLS